MLNFSGKAVINVIGDTTAPTLTGAAVDGATLTLTYSETLSEFSDSRGDGLHGEGGGQTR